MSQLDSARFNNSVVYLLKIPKGETAKASESTNCLCDHKWVDIVAFYVMMVGITVRLTSS